jgi:signal transduction histidine kinase/CheY-like chemotaxis protein
MTGIDEQINILLVDDEAESLVAIDAVLEPLSLSIVRARSGREALRKLLQEDFALILLDVVMPDIDGFETARLIRARNRTRDTPIIFLTALTPGEIPIGQAYSLGAVDYILKPIEPEILRSKVAVFAELARKRALVERQAAALREADQREHERQLADERTRAREALLRREVEVSQREHQWLEHVLNALPSPLIMLEPGTAERLFMNSMARCFPWSRFEPGEAVEITDRDRNPLPPESLPLARAAAGQKLDGLTFRWRTKEGEGAFVAFSEELPRRSGHEATILVTLLDVTQLLEVEANLKSAVQVRDAFLSIASHELKTPLTTLGLQVQRLMRASRRGTPLTSTGEKSDPLQVLDRASHRLTKLINDLLDVSRIAAGKLEVERAEVDLAEVVRDVSAQLKEDFIAAGCPVEVHIDGPCVGFWDRSRLEQVLSNLSVNAMKYGSGKPIRISVERTASAGVLVVSDEGIGIPPRDQARVFERFERAVSDREYGGLGLGLWIVREIVEGMEGRISLESAPGVGSTFRVTLPFRPSLREVERTEREHEESESKSRTAMDAHANGVEPQASVRHAARVP